MTLPPPELPCPHEVCATLDEPLSWGEGKLREKGIPMPQGARNAWVAPRAVGQ